MSFAVMLKALSNVEAGLDNVSEAAERAGRAHQTAQEKLGALRLDKQAEAIRAIESGVAANLWACWWQIAAIDANDPGLSALETELRRFSGADTSFLAAIKRRISKVQQENRRRAGSSKVGRGGALTEDQLAAMLDEVSGRT
jgi:hypothetical protein